MEIFVISSIIGIFAASWVYFDAHGRTWAPERSGAAAWTFLTLVFGIWALPFYFSARSRTRPVA